MRTVHELSKIAGVSVRTLHYYDQIGLLEASAYTEAGYRLYDDDKLETLQQILLFRELEFSLAEIKVILKSPDFDRDLAIDQQIELLNLKRQHI
ncbi:MAG: MerR family transcriptional regulator, partial [Eubacteriales bacterium]|nr:MerR family transcriptional regulator [Eubacteriales bacterium]